MLLGFSAGLPLPLTGFTLRQWFAEAGVSLGAIGLTALIGLAYTLKFLWAPVLDHARPPLPRLGRRRGWLAPVQVALGAAILAMGFTDPARDAEAPVVAAVAVAFLSATQDIAIDALRIESLPPARQGLGLAAYVWGYRIALLVANAGALGVVELAGWRAAFAVMAGLMGVGLATTLLLAREPLPPGTTLPASWGARLRLAVIDPFRDFLRRPGWPLILAFVALFKLGEALAGIMTAPFYRALGFSRLDVAAVSGVFGMAATLAGVTLGGVLVARTRGGPGAHRHRARPDAVQPHVRRPRRGGPLRRPPLGPGGGGERDRWPRRCGLRRLPFGPDERRLHRHPVRSPLLACRRAAAHAGRDGRLPRRGDGLDAVLPAHHRRRAPRHGADARPVVPFPPKREAE
ncbi:MAG: MFS transporter [Acetobacteraceae bacterium]|nr:MFS transporter [Acetobacteraceae bacterium]